MKHVLFAALLAVLPFLCMAQEQTNREKVEPSPDQVYYQMIHNDSLFLQSMESVRQYGRIRSRSKGLELVGGIILGVTAYLSSTGEISSGTPIHNIFLFSGAGLMLTGWITDWIAISELKEVGSYQTVEESEPDNSSFHSIIESRKKKKD